MRGTRKDIAATRKSLEDARSRDEIVRVFREGLEDGWVEGYVEGLGPEYFLLQVFDKACRLDGFNCLRYCDVTQVTVPAPHARFLEKAVQARGQSRASADIDLATLPRLLHSGAKAFSMVTIHLEGHESVCYIGTVERVTVRELHLLQISPDAEWDVTASIHDLAEITRVDFGGAYEEALYLVASASR